MEEWVCEVTFRGTCDYVEGEAQIEVWDFKTGVTVQRPSESPARDIPPHSAGSTKGRSPPKIVPLRGGRGWAVLSGTENIE